MGIRDFFPDFFPLHHPQKYLYHLHTFGATDLYFVTYFMKIRLIKEKEQYTAELIDEEGIVVSYAQAETPDVAIDISIDLYRIRQEIEQEMLQKKLMKIDTKRLFDAKKVLYPVEITL